MGLTRDLINSRVSLIDKLYYYTDDLEMFEFFVGHKFKLKNPFSSPFREDNKPSFSIYADASTGNLKFHDITKRIKGNIFIFVKAYALYNDGLELNKFTDIIKYIDKKMNLNMTENEEFFKDSHKKENNFYEGPTEIFYKTRSFTKLDLNYWKDLDVGEELLNKYNVRSVKFLLDSKGIVYKQFKNNEICFIYEIWDKIKMYQPYENVYNKFRNTCPGDDIRYMQGFPQLQHFSTLIITKSLKDILTLAAQLEKVDFLAPHSETIKYQEKFLNWAIKNYNRIVIIYDYDKEGVLTTCYYRRAFRKLNFEIEYHFINTKREMINNKLKVIPKDSADFRLMYGQDKFRELLSSWNLPLNQQNKYNFNIEL